MAATLAFSGFVASLALSTMSDSTRLAAPIGAVLGDQELFLVAVLVVVLGLVAVVVVVVVVSVVVLLVWCWCWCWCSCTADDKLRRKCRRQLLEVELTGSFVICRRLRAGRGRNRAGYFLTFAPAQLLLPVLVTAAARPAARPLPTLLLLVLLRQG